MKYSIKQMASLLGTTTHKLRHYQKMGIIKPETDALTGYRYYSVLDTRRFNMACYYCNLGFTLQESLDLLSSSDLNYINKKMSLKKEEIKKDIIYKELCLSRIDEMNLEIENIEKSLNKILIFEVDETVRLEISKGEIIIENKHLLNKRDELINYSPIVKWVSRIPSEIIEKTSGNLEYYHGLNIKLKDAKKLGIDISNFDILPKGKYIYTVFKKNTRDPFEWETLSVIQDYIKENNIKNTNSAYSTCIFSTVENGDYLNFHKIMLKI